MRIVSDGIHYACACLLVAFAGSYFLGPVAGIPFYVLAAFCLYFFRDPDRVTPAGDVIVSPADGKVVAVLPVDGSGTRISIFLNVFNVHVNRTPVPGTILNIEYQAGKFMNAGHEAASADNERNTLTLAGPRGRVVCKQIAGLIARRIVCYKKPGDVVAPGERIGYIKFGSRMDVIFGPEYEANVQVGDKVKAGASVLARPAQGLSNTISSVGAFTDATSHDAGSYA